MFRRLVLERAVRATEILIVPLLLIGSALLVLIVVRRAFAWMRLADSMSDAMSRIQAENLIFGTLGKLVGGAFVLAGLYFSAKSFVVSRRAQSSERLSAALASLSEESVASRLGGISVLGGLLRHSTDDYQVVVDALCAFVRNATSSAEYRRDFADRRPRDDVQGALTALAMRRWSFGLGEPVAVDLRGTFLPQADLRNGNLTGFDFGGADLVGAVFWQATLGKANFQKAQLRGADFRRTDLRQTNFLEASAEESLFRGAFLTRTNFTRAIVSGAAFSDSKLSRVRFASADLTGAVFYDSMLSACDFTLVKGELPDLSVATPRGCKGLTTVPAEPQPP